jgi:hypothetical protein
MDPFTLCVSRSVLLACIRDPAPVLMMRAGSLPPLAPGVVLHVHGPIPEEACRLRVTAVAGRDPIAVAVAVTRLTTCRVCGGPISSYDALCDQRCFLCWLADLVAEPLRPARFARSLPRTYLIRRRFPRHFARVVGLR